MEKGHSFQQMVLGKLESHIQKIEIGFLSYTTYKNKLKMYQRPKVRVDTIKLLEENTGQKLHNTGLSNDFLDDTKSIGQ